jgi:hypothetical protein
MLIVYAFNNFKYYMGLEVAWSIYVWLFIPMCAGVVTVLVTDLFRFQISKTPMWQRLVWVAILLIFAGLVAWGASQDSNRLPSAQTIAAINGVSIGDYAVRVDQCLRDSDTCAGSGLDQAELLSQAGHCPAASSQAFAKLFGTAQPSRDTKVYAYVCALLAHADTTRGNANRNGIDISLNAIAYVAAFLKWMIYCLVILFLFSLFYNSFVTSLFRINPETLFGLIIAWGIFSMWFPFRLFSDWALWYQDLSHLVTGDPPFFISLAAAIVAFVIIVIGFVVTFGQLDPIKTAAAAWSALAAFFGLLIALKPDEVTKSFYILYSLPISLVVPAILLLFGIVAGQIYAFIAMTSTR